MTMTTVRGGIIDFDVALPRGRMTVQQMHDWSGVSVPEILEVTHCAEIPAFSPEENAWELAVEAAAEVLKRTETDPASITRLIYAGAGYWDAPAWSPAAKTADELGITQAHCFEVTNFCNALTLAVGIAIDGLSGAAGERALVVAAERFAFAVDRHDPDSKGLFNFGDAASAVLVGASGRFAFLGASARTDPQWCDYFIGDYHETGVYTRRRGHRDGLADAYVKHLVACTRSILDQIGKGVDQVRYLLINQNDKKIQDRVLDALGLPPTRSVFSHSRLGHMGCSDTMIALRRLWDDNALSHGDLVLLATSGAGFSWSVTALEYRLEHQ
jgi:3-oxoacyl-[acyl-carrier-protein] synthase III